MVSNELLNFTNSEESFYENNLLDADDWGKDLSSTLDAFDSSPSSSNDSDTFGDYNPQSYFLNDDDMETWLNETLPMNSPESDKVLLVKEEPSSPPMTEFTDNDISASTLSNCKDSSSNPSEFKNMPKLLTLNEITNKLLRSAKPVDVEKKDHSSTRISETKTQQPNKLINNLPSSKGNSIIGKVNVITSQIPIKSVNKGGNPTNKSKNQNIKTIIVPAGGSKIILSPAKTENLVSKLPKTNGLSSTSATAKVVKLENGQYYVAPSLPTPTNNNKFQVSMSKPILKRPSDIKVEHLLSDAKDFAELKNAKRQQRMMKNRESACLSRQRKKQHLKNLEDRVSVITDMNQKLKQENDILKQRIQLLETENKELRDQPLGGQIKRNIKKATFLCALFVFFGFQIFRQKFDLQDDMYKSQNRMSYAYVHRGRSLLQYDNSNIDTFDTEIHQKHRYDIIDKPFNFEKKEKMKKENRRSKFVKVDKYKNMKIAGVDDIDDCGGHFNQSHLTRINKDLEGLVHGLRKGKKKKKPKKILEKLLSSNSTVFSKDNEDNCNQTKGKKTNGNNRPITTASYIKFLRSSEKMKKPIPSRDSSSIKEPDNTIQELASLVQKSITRKSDTFYVISLIRDMLILPATNFSSTHRPKVTFMLPAYVPYHGKNDTQVNSEDKLPIIQIDCNVVDTKLTGIERSSLSKHLLTHFMS